MPAESTALARWLEHLPGLHDQKDHGRKGARGAVKSAVKAVAKAAISVVDEPKPARRPDAGGGSRGQRLRAGIASGVGSERKLGGGAQGLTKRVTFNDGTEAIHKTNKRQSQGNISAKDQTDAEEISAGLAARLGLTAPAVEREDDARAYLSLVPGDPAVKVINAKVKGSSGLLDPDKDKALTNTDQGRLVGLLDIIINNTDRHGGNWLVERPDDLDNPGIGVIDHGMAFNARWADPLYGAIDGRGRFVQHYRTRNPTPGDGRPLFVYGDNDLSPADVASARAALEAMRPDFERLGRTDWYEGALARLELVAAGAKGTKVRIPSA